jgi:hypothetical protein
MAEMFDLIKRQCDEYAYHLIKDYPDKEQLQNKISAWLYENRNSCIPGLKSQIAEYLQQIKEYGQTIEKTVQNNRDKDNQIAKLTAEVELRDRALKLMGKKLAQTININVPELYDTWEAKYLAKAQEEQCNTEKRQS